MGFDRFLNSPSETLLIYPRLLLFLWEHKIILFLVFLVSSFHRNDSIIDREFTKFLKILGLFYLRGNLLRVAFIELLSSSLGTEEGVKKLLKKILKNACLEIFLLAMAIIHKLVLIVVNGSPFHTFIPHPFGCTAQSPPPHKHDIPKQFV